MAVSSTCKGDGKAYTLTIIGNDLLQIWCLSSLVIMQVLENIIPC